MSRSRRREALDGHRQRIQQLISCVSTGVITFSRPEQTRFVESGSMVLNRGMPVQCWDSPLQLRVAQEFLVRLDATPDPIVIIGYNYTIQYPSEGELVSYQWHPSGRAPIRFPHVHIGPAMARRNTVVRAGEAHRIHLPTGEITLADVVRLAIAELGVTPRRDDWEVIVDPLDRPG